MASAVRIGYEDQLQIPVIGKIKLHFNSNDEWIWVSMEYAGEEYRQQITDDSYSGGTNWADITRTKTFNEFQKQ